MKYALWILQVLLGLLFLFAGVMKFVMPPEQMLQGPGNFSLGFLRFIGVVEILGGLGLILPSLLRILPILTPLAAAGLVIVMIGATVVSFQGGAMMALMPLVVTLLLIFVAYGRWRSVPIPPRA